MGLIIFIALFLVCVGIALGMWHVLVNLGQHGRYQVRIR